MTVDQASASVATLIDVRDAERHQPLCVVAPEGGRIALQARSRLIAEIATASHGEYVLHAVAVDEACGAQSSRGPTCSHPSRRRRGRRR